MSDSLNLDQYWNTVRELGPSYFEKMSAMADSGRIWGDLPQQLTEFLKSRFETALPSSSVKEMWLLDVGCGDGRLAFHFAKKGFKVVGIDYSQGAIQEALQKQSLSQEAKEMSAINVHFLEADVMSERLLHELESRGLPEHFDAVFLYKFIHQWRPKELDQLIRKLTSLVRVGGYVFVGTISRQDVNYGKGKCIEEHVFDSRNYRPVHFFSRESVKEVLENAGLRINEIEEIDEGPPISHPERLAVKFRWMLYLVAQRPAESNSSPL